MNDNDTNTPARDDDIAKLVRLAGKRAAVPHERAERVRQAAQATWSERVERRRSRHALIWKAVAAASVAFVFFLVLRGGPSAPPATDSGSAGLVVEALSGAAWRAAPLSGDGASPVSLALGETLVVGDPLTTGDSGRVALRLPSGHSVRLDLASSIVVERDSVIALLAGGLYVDSGPDADPAVALEIRTATGTIHEVGTQFAVRTLDNGSLTVRLREGSVLVRRDGVRHQVKAGAELSIAAGGVITRRRIAPDDAQWAWAESIAPPLELAGRTASAVLDQIAREKGWALAFADEQAARRATQTVLGGSLAPMPIEGALDAVLPTCRLLGQVHDGRLIVSLESQP